MLSSSSHSRECFTLFISFRFVLYRTAVQVSKYPPGGGRVVYVKYYTSAVRPYPRISYNTGRVACEVVVWGH